MIGQAENADQLSNLQMMLHAYGTGQSKIGLDAKNVLFRVTNSVQVLLFKVAS